MKKFINEHPKLYWMIVGVLAVIVFSVVTAIGCAKINRAEAAVEFTVNAPSINTYTMPTFQQVVDAVVDTFGVQPSDVTAENTVMFTSDGQAYSVFYGNDIDRLECYGLADGCGINAKQTVTRISINALTDTVATSSFSGGYMSIKSTRNEYQGYVWGAPVYCWERNGTMPILTPVTVYPKGGSYDKDAPYSMFESFGHDNKLVNGDAKGSVLEGLYNTHTALSKWSYGGKLVNTSPDDVSYNVAMTVTVEIPNDTLINFIADNMDVDLGWDHEVLKYMPAMYDVWSGYTGSDYSKYTFTVDLPCVTNDRGEWGYDVPYLNTEYLLMMDDNFRARFQQYNADADLTHWKAIVLGFMHIDTVTTVVETTRPDSVVYGYVHSVRFERGYEHWYSSTVKVDKDFVSNEALDIYIEQELSVAQREHLNELENRLDEMQNQIDNMQDFEGSFGTDLSGGDLWNGIKSLGSGLVGLTGFLSNIALVIGNLFVFLPYDVRQIAGYFFLASLIVALWKLIKR